MWHETIDDGKNDLTMDGKGMFGSLATSTFCSHQHVIFSWKHLHADAR